MTIRDPPEELKTRDRVLGDLYRSQLERMDREYMRQTSPGLAKRAKVSTDEARRRTRRARNSKSKGRRHQQEVTELIAIRFGLKIAAVLPTKPGTRANGAVYVPEHEGDIRPRRMSESGVDVVLMSERARTAVAIWGRPLYIECKNDQTLPFDSAEFWRTGEAGIINRAFEQIAAAADSEGHFRVVVVSKNRWPIYAAWRENLESLGRFARAHYSVGFHKGFGWQALPLGTFMEMLDGASATRSGEAR